MSRKFIKSPFTYGTSQDFSRPLQDPEEVRLANDWEHIENIRAPQTVQMGINTIPQTAQMGMQTEHPRIHVVPTVLKPGRVIERRHKPVEVLNAKRDNLKIMNINPVFGRDKTTSMQNIQTAQMGMNARPQTAQMGMQARPQTGQMGLQARPQTGQMAINARPQTGQMGMQARPQTGQMGLQAQKQQKPVMVSMGTMMVQQPEQVKTQPSIMQSIGAMFGLNEEKEEEEFIFYGYKTDPEPLKRELRKYGVTYLRKLAKENGLKRYSTVDKKELVKMLAVFYAGRQEMNYNNRNCLGKKELKSDYTLQELRKAASKLKLKAYSKLSKNDLCQVLHYYDNVHSKATEEARKYLDNIYKKKNNL